MSDTTTATPVSTPAPEAPTAPANNGGWDDVPETPAEPTPPRHLKNLSVSLLNG